MENTAELLAQSIPEGELTSYEEEIEGDPYFRKMAILRRELNAACQGLMKKQIEACKLRFEGLNYVEVGKTVGATGAQVSKWMNRQDCRHVLSMFARIELHSEGPLDGQKQHMLWNIARSNLKKDPRVSISAIAESNKMNHNHELLARGHTGDTKVEIVINNTALARGALD